MAETQTQIYYIATSKIKEMREDASITGWDWGTMTSWRKFKNPSRKSKKKVKYNKKSKNKPNTTSGSKTAKSGGVTVLGTKIPATATRMIAGVSRTVEVRYFQRGYIKYKRTDKMKKKKQMLKTTYTNSKPYQYRLQYRDKPITDTTYTAYEDGTEFVFFSDSYLKDGKWVTRKGHVPHPINCSMQFIDCRRNFDSNAKNSDGRDNYGTYVLSNVRSNILVMSLEWQGLTEKQGILLLDTLNPERTWKDKKTKKTKSAKSPYLQVQYRNPQTGNVTKGVFFAKERSVTKLPNGYYGSISVELEEV